MRIELQQHAADIRMATEADAHLPWYDYTRLAAVNTCPTWGVLRYDMHKQAAGAGRAIALEAGSAMHDVFAFVRLVTLLEWHQKDKPQHFLDQVWNYQCTRLYGGERAEQLIADCQGANDTSDLCRRGAISVLNTSGFYDDPRDKQRTLSNMEECAYAYINRWRFDHPVWVRNPSDATSDVGIEVPFDVVVNITGVHPLSIRFAGRIDGLHTDALGRLTVHDNKTASRLGDAWTMAQEISHQYTGYCIAASVFTQQVVSRCDVLGLAIPLPRAYDFGGFAREGMSRDTHHLQRWLVWLIHSVNMLLTYRGDPFSAPKYTHSCNRYFRPCSFIPFCYATDEEQQDMLSEMVDDEWSPLQKKVVLQGVGSE